ETPSITDTEQTDGQNTKQDGPSPITNAENINSKDTEQDEPSTLTNTETINSQDSKQDEPGTSEKQHQKDALQLPEMMEDVVANGSSTENMNNTEEYDGVDRVSGSENTSGLYKDRIRKNVIQNQQVNKDAVANSGKGLQNNNTQKDTESKAIKNTLSDIRIDNTTAGSDTDTSENTNTSKIDDNRKTQDGIAINREATKRDSEESEKAIAQSDQIEKGNFVNDTIPKNRKKSIFEALEAQNEEEEVAEASESRWSAGPNVAPVYFDAMGEGSPIDPGFSPNAKSGSANMSYGVSIAYAVTKKLSVRSGIHKTEYGYNTNDVGFSPTLAASTNGKLQNIDYVGGAENLTLNSSVSDAASPESVASEFNSLNATRDGNVSQQFGYLEIPIELDYALLDNRFGVNLIGGISSLFLVNNSVTLSSDALTTEIGEASNLNSVNFSTNVGFGVNYKLTPKIKLNIEPVFKYQLNTFSNVSGNFRPFSIGVYSGLNFKF
ncbi:MAG: hypothetical protein WBG48_09600, partial [Pricia sp.]